MKAAIIKDLLLCKTNLRSYLLFIAMFTIIGFSINNPYYATGVTIIVPIMCMVSSVLVKQSCYSKVEFA